MLLIDSRFGLLIAMPIAILAIALLVRRRLIALPMRELMVCLGLSFALILFFSTVQDTRLQWVTGIRVSRRHLPVCVCGRAPGVARVATRAGLRPRVPVVCRELEHRLWRAARERSSRIFSAC